MENKYNVYGKIYIVRYPIQRNETILEVNIIICFQYDRIEKNQKI